MRATSFKTSEIFQAIAVVSFATAAISILYSTIVNSNRKRRRNKRNQRASSQTKASNWSSSSSSQLLDHDNAYICYTNLALPPHTVRKIEKERRRKSKAELLSMKSPMYDNVFMLDPSGHLMCTISMKKAKWYVRKKIAVWHSSHNEDNHGEQSIIQNDEKYIRLLFEPCHQAAALQQNEDTASQDLYLRTAKQNICVTCGCDGHHMRHYIVPYAYRSLLPEEYKSHMSHDVVILCPECHFHCDQQAKRRMNRMENDLRSKLLLNHDSSSVNTYDWWTPAIEDEYLYHVRSCAMALVKQKDNMPIKRVKSYERIVCHYLALNSTNDSERDSLLRCEYDEVVELTKDQLQRACSVNYRVKNPNYITGSELVVNSLNGDCQNIEQFIIEWRCHFITTMNPKFMPLGWNLYNPVICKRKKTHDVD